MHLVLMGGARARTLVYRVVLLNRVEGGSVCVQELVVLAALRLAEMYLVVDQLRSTGWLLCCLSDGMYIDRRCLEGIGY